MTPAVGGHNLIDEQIIKVTISASRLNMSPKMLVPIHDFKSHLSSYLTQARAGLCIELTSHRKIVARVIGVPATDQGGLAHLVASGNAQWAGGKPAGADITLSQQEHDLADLVLEDRG